MADRLQIRNLTKRFDGVEALRDVSFEVHAGEAVALIGPNGAGKTTCFNIVGGQMRADVGEVTMSGTRIDALSPQAIARLGVGRTFQVAATFASMTARENVALALLANHGGDLSFAWSSLTRVRQDADDVLARTGIAALAEAHCGSLAYGDAKRLELALALANDPQLLLMDEPTAGMGAASRTSLMRLATAMARERNAAVLFTEHDMDVVFGFADRVIVLDRGRVIASGPPERIRADPDVQAIYLGTPDHGPAARP